MSLFNLNENKTTFTTEILAGLTTFLTMSYIIIVNPDILSATGMDKNALVIITCLASALGTFLMAIFANYPIALAPGMGLNAFFAFGVVLNMKINGEPVTWQMALAAVFIEGAIFTVLTLTNIRESIMNAIPKSLKIGISAGIGLFIAFIGLQSAVIVINNDATLVGLGRITNNTPMILAMLGLFIMSVLTALKVKAALLIGIIAVTGISTYMGLTPMPDKFFAMPEISSITPLMGKLDFSMIKAPEFWVVVFAFFFVDFFDTLGTLVGVCSRSGLLDENGNLPRAKGALMADAVATMAGAVMGTSTVTSYVESSSGVAQGGRTGLTALTTALLFIAAIFLTPLVTIVPGYATAPALILVGVYMMMSLRDINYDDWTELIPSLVGFFMMPFAYSIAVGIEFAIILYVAMKILTGKFKDVSLLMIALSVLFIVYEFLLKA